MCYGSVMGTGGCRRTCSAMIESTGSSSGTSRALNLLWFFSGAKHRRGQALTCGNRRAVALAAYARIRCRVGPARSLDATGRSAAKPHPTTTWHPSERPASEYRAVARRGGRVLRGLPGPGLVGRHELELLSRGQRLLRNWAFTPDTARLREDVRLTLNAHAGASNNVY